MSALFINGEWSEGKGSVLTSTTPDEKHILWEEHSASVSQVNEAVLAARNAFLLWRHTPLTERKAIAISFAEILKTRQQQLAEYISQETGKPLWESITEVTAMVNKVTISIRAQEQRAGEIEQGRLQLSHRPHGVMAVFGAYNFPGHLANGHIVPALLAGNTIVFKPSDLTPWAAEFIVKCWEEAGIPKGVMNLVQGGKEVGEALCTANINGLLFTGSSNTGKLLHKSMAGKPEVLLALEMGGNNPLVVSDTQNIEFAVNTIVQSAFLSAGQRCTCARRLIVVENESTTHLVAALLDLRDRIIVGTWNDSEEPFLGPLINIAAAKKLLESQQYLISIGGKPLRRSEASDLGLPFLTPGILDMTDALNAPDEELFGPILQLYRVNSFNEALALANNTKFGLAAGLISDDLQEQEIFKSEINAGVISINAPTAGASSELPFGGIGASGNHRASAFYAADYCAWPQALTQGGNTQQQNNLITRGVRYG